MFILANRFTHFFLGIVYLCLLYNPVNAQHFEWANSGGGLGLDIGRDVCSDNQGNVIAVGTFTESAHFSNIFLNGMGHSDGFVCKYNPEGDLLWARMITGPNDDMINGVVADPAGNVYVVGHYTDTVVFVLNQTDTVAATGFGGQDMFIAKYNSEGDFQWFVRGGGTGEDTGTDIEWSSGKLYVSGGFEKRGSFGQLSVLSSGLSDAVLVKMDSDGNTDWVVNGGGLGYDLAATVAVDPVEGTIYIAGNFSGNTDFGGTQLNAVGSSDMFLVKYAANGTFEWAESNGGTSVDVATKLGCDYNGNVFVSGHYQGTTFFQNHTVTALSYNDVFLSKFDGNGTCQWLRSAGSYGLDNCMGMDVAADGTTFLCGLFEDVMIADEDSLIGNGYDIFVLKHDASGQYVRGVSAGAASADMGMATCLGPDETLFITGYYYFFADFDEHTIGAADYGDMFLAKLGGLVGIEEFASNKNDCLHYNWQTNTVALNCSFSGDWSLRNLLGQIVVSGQGKSSQIHLPELTKGLYLFSVFNLKDKAVIPVLVN